MCAPHHPGCDPVSPEVIKRPTKIATTTSALMEVKSKAAPKNAATAPAIPKTTESASTSQLTTE
jgi:hypothetical protein